MADSTPHILIVDDDETARNLVKLTVQRAGYKTSLAPSAEEALKIIYKSGVDVVVSDIKMPGKSGFDLLKSAKEFDRNLPVIILTSYGSLDDAIKAIRLGVHDFLKKPSSAQEIRDSIRHALLDRARLEAPQPASSIVINIPSLPKGNLLIKRLFDIIGSLAGLMLLSPVMAVIYVLVRVKMGQPVFFRQTRPGLRGKPFTLYKFRTMKRLQQNQQGKLIADTGRITPLGAFLRSSSLDELPELFNVLRGEMSLVGPRPLLMEYLDRYSPHAARRHEVKPGITGWAQVNGRNLLAWDQKFDLDVWYIDHHSIRLDMKILFMTVAQILKREGISHPQHPTMPEFVKPDEEELDMSQMVKEKSDGPD